MHFSTIIFGALVAVQALAGKTTTVTQTVTARAPASTVTMTSKSTSTQLKTITSIITKTTTSVSTSKVTVTSTSTRTSTSTATVTSTSTSSTTILLTTTNTVSVCPTTTSGLPISTGTVIPIISTNPTAPTVPTNPTAPSVPTTPVVPTTFTNPAAPTISTIPTGGSPGSCSTFYLQILGPGTPIDGQFLEMEPDGAGYEDYGYNTPDEAYGSLFSIDPALNDVVSDGYEFTVDLEFGAPYSFIHSDSLTEGEDSVMTPLICSLSSDNSQLLCSLSTNGENLLFQYCPEVSNGVLLGASDESECTLLSLVPVCAEQVGIS